MQQVTIVAKVDELLGDNIVKQRSDGKSYRAIGKTLNAPVSTVSSIMNSQVNTSPPLNHEATKCTVILKCKNQVSEYLFPLSVL